MPAVVARQEIERGRAGVPIALEEHAQVGVAKVAEHEARHVAGSYPGLRSGLPPEQPSNDGALGAAHCESPSFCELLSESVNDPIACARNLGFLRP
jgi:hypothetical protein